MHCPKCGCVDRVKNGKANGLPRFKCKGCGCNYTKSTRRGYALEMKKRAIALYLEGLGFRAIERLLDISHMSVMRWVRDMAQQIQTIKAAQKGEAIHATVMELDEMWHYVGKKNRQLWLWLAVDRDTKDVIAFRVGSRGRKTLKKLLFLNNLRADIYATDHYRAYNILPQDRHIQSKAHTYTVEAKNAQIRHYLARFHRRTKCYSKAVHMVIASLILYFNQYLIPCIYY